MKEKQYFCCNLSILKYKKLKYIHSEVTNFLHKTPSRRKCLVKFARKIVNSRNIIPFVLWKWYQLGGSWNALFLWKDQLGLFIFCMWSYKQHYNNNHVAWLKSKRIQLISGQPQPNTTKSESGPMCSSQLFCGFSKDIYSFYTCISE